LELEGEKKRERDEVEIKKNDTHMYAEGTYFLQGRGVERGAGAGGATDAHAPRAQT